jgi:thymidylate kinase
METSKQLTIFEGPDGGGKTTAALAYAEATGARYVHFSSLPHVKRGLPRMYVEAMLPALLGYQDVVFDRCWLSEAPYGMEFREGELRFDRVAVRMLERLALRCSAAVVLCLPPLKKALGNFSKRKAEEMLDNEEQLTRVYEHYETKTMLDDTVLPVALYDYTKGDLDISLVKRAKLHPLDLATAGNWDAPFVLVGDKFAEPKDQDAFYQWPFASFNDSGCSRWVTNELELESIYESELLWVNADQDLNFLNAKQNCSVIAMGIPAMDALKAIKFKEMAYWIDHPQFWKRFKTDEKYPLSQVICDSTKILHLKVF